MWPHRYEWLLRLLVQTYLTVVGVQGQQAVEQACRDGLERMTTSAFYRVGGETDAGPRFICIAL